MHLTMQHLQEHAAHLEQQVAQHGFMAQQATGALNYIRDQIRQMMAAEAESKKEEIPLAAEAEKLLGESTEPQPKTEG